MLSDHYRLDEWFCIFTNPDISRVELVEDPRQRSFCSARRKCPWGVTVYAGRVITGKRLKGDSEGDSIRSARSKSEQLCVNGTVKALVQTVSQQYEQTSI